jgi:endoglucanase
MAKLKAKYIDNGIPVYMGETGCSNRSTDRQKRFQAYYLEFFYKACRNYGMAPFYWDNGSEATGKESGAVINHSTGEYVLDGKTLVAAMKKAVFTESASYTLRSVYESAPTE